MEIFILVLLVVSICINVYFLIRKKPKHVGSIILEKDQSLYVELNDSSSMNQIWNSNEVIFKVHKIRNVESQK